jgi:chromosomal replication initiator protein
MTKASLKEIGEAFNRDHGTVIHAVKRVTRELENDESLQARIDSIENRLREAYRE